MSLSAAAQAVVTRITEKRSGTGDVPHDPTTDRLVLLAEVVKKLDAGAGGGGGGDFLPLAGGTMNESAEIAFTNNSRIRQTPGATGLDLVCSVDYVHRWKEGSLYILDTANTIRIVMYGIATPDSSFDFTQGYSVGSRFIKDDGTTYVCTDSTEAAAVWTIVANHKLVEVADDGAFAALTGADVKVGDFVYIVTATEFPYLSDCILQLTREGQEGVYAGYSLIGPVDGWLAQFYASGGGSGARTALGLGTVATENTVPINKGGTGATTAAAAAAAIVNGNPIAPSRLSVTGAAAADIQINCTASGYFVIRATTGSAETLTYDTNNAALVFQYAGSNRQYFGPNGVVCPAYGGIKWTSSSSAWNVGPYVGFFWSGANTLKLTDGSVTYQDLQLRNLEAYGTYTSATNYERLKMCYNSGTTSFQIGTEKGSGGGSARALDFMTDGIKRMSLSTSYNLTLDETAQISAFTGIGTKYDFTFNGVQFSSQSGLGLSWSNTTNASSGKHVGVFAYSDELGVVQINSTTKGTFRDLRVRSVIQQPPASVTPSSNGDLVFEATSNTSVTMKLKGTDGTVRSVVFTLV